MDGSLCPYSKTEVMCVNDMNCSTCDIFKEYWQREVEPSQKALDYTQQYLQNPLSSEKTVKNKEQIDRFRRNKKQ